MKWIGLALALVVGVGILGCIMSIGKERKPMTPKMAAVVTVVNTVLMVFLLKICGWI